LKRAEFVQISAKVLGDMADLRVQLTDIWKSLLDRQLRVENRLISKRQKMLSEHPGRSTSSNIHYLSSRTVTTLHYIELIYLTGRGYIFNIGGDDENFHLVVTHGEVSATTRLIRKSIFITHIDRS
jgi:hypothetical protein